MGETGITVQCERCNESHVDTNGLDRSVCVCVHVCVLRERVREKGEREKWISQMG